MRTVTIVVLSWVLTGVLSLDAATNDAAAKLVTSQGMVQYTTSRATNWTSAPIGQRLAINDLLRTLELSRASVELQDFSVLRVNELSLLEILPPRQGSAKARLDFRSGALYFLHRNRPREIEVETPNATAAIEGTEFHLSVDANNVTVLTMIDGKVGLTNALGGVSLGAGEQGIAEPGQPPRKTAVVQTVNIIQWSLYYPGVLDPAELGLDGVAPLGASLAAYRSGDLLAALANYPAGRVAASPAERIYYAGLVLCAGRATNYEALLQTVDANHPLTSALARMVAAVKLQTNQFAPAANASQLLGQSYYFQSQFLLSQAVRSAREAVARSTNFAFGWERVAELEFSFGRLASAESALTRALALAPRNGQAHALKGFLLLGRDDLSGAVASFEEALRLDNTLANGWLGRGLSRIRQRRADEGRADLQMAAALEPNRWLLRSYLGKAYANAADKASSRALRKELDAKALAELELARAKDPNDPTPWLYSALLDYQKNRIGEAVNDLEESIDRNQNRAVYRSRLLLDQDRSVRNANLANIYKSAGMTEVSLRESAAAVTYDYGNSSAHYNLASSFNALRDPTRFNLRHESDWFHELLLANLLQQGGGASLSQHLSQEEYSRPFEEKNRLGFTSSTEYFSEGEVRQQASQFGTFDKTSYAMDLDYDRKSGVRPNNDLSRVEWYTRVKEQLTEQDSLFLLTKYQDYESGDNFQYYDPGTARRNFRLTEKQEPIVLAGYHREWTPGVHTLLLGGRLVNDQHYSDEGRDQTLLALDATTAGVTNVFSLPMNVDYRSEFEIYSFEANQIIQRERHTDVLGARYQTGHFDTQDRLTLDPASVFGPYFNSPPAGALTDEPFERIAAYGYHTWEMIDRVFLTAGISYDRVTYPDNFRVSPISAGHSTRDRLSPKVSLIWRPRSEVTFRGAYLRSLGGVSYDESVRLEPTQLAGFGQSFRSVISESLVGSVSAPAYDVGGAAVDLKFPTRTYLGVEAQWLQSDLRRSVGAFSYTSLTFPPPPIQPTSTPEQLDYTEKSIKVTLNQVVANDLFFEAQYKITRSKLDDDYPAIPSSANAFAHTSGRAEMQQVGLSGLYIHPCGVFARAESWWFIQHNLGDSSGLRGESLQQINLYAGYLFPRRRGELTIGILNVTDQDYRLNPLNPYSELPRERLFYARLKINL